MPEPTMDGGRRRFLTGAAATVGGVAALLGLLKLPTTAAAELPPISEGVIFPDPSLCVGCGACEVQCGQVHGAAGLSAIPRIKILFKDSKFQAAAVADGKAMGNGGYVPMPCKQCPDPECYVLCPADALKIDSHTGARYIDEKVCIGCGKCEVGCPFKVDGVLALTESPLAGKRIFFDAQKKVYTKCDLCYWRPEGPACVAACPVNQAIKTGVRKSDRLCLDVKRSDDATYKQIG